MLAPTEVADQMRIVAIRTASPGLVVGQNNHNLRSFRAWR